MSKNIEICKAEEVGAQVMDELAKNISSVQERAKQYGISIASPDPSTAKITELRAVLSVFATKVMDVFNSFIAGLQSTIASLNASIAAYIAQIADINADIADAYDAVEDKGGTLPQEQTSANLPTSILSIPQGSTKLKIVNLPAGAWRGLTYEDMGEESIDFVENWSWDSILNGCPNVKKFDCRGITVNSFSSLWMRFWMSNDQNLEEVYLNFKSAPTPASAYNGQWAYNNIKLRRIILGEWNVWGFNISNAGAMTRESLVEMFNSLPNAANSSQVITLGSAKLNLLSQEDRAIALNKGWQLS